MAVDKASDAAATSPGPERAWQYLAARPHPWRRQLGIKGRNMTVGQLVSTIRANRLSPEQASADLGLPLEAVHEALAYFDANQDLIQAEAAEERRRLAERGYPLEPRDLSR
ncbi:MAG TPA: hypothetical protein VG013_27780 [Gemmataceae bacterium]|jgi:uncharacterized protein (DUF433 family)|nr:hypothetical protein [Gemmataceae bacterium]